MRARPAAQPFATEIGERLLRSAHPAAHQLVAVEHDHEIPAPPIEGQFLSAGNLRRSDEFACLHATFSRRGPPPGGFTAMQRGVKGARCDISSIQNSTASASSEEHPSEL